MNPKMSLQYFPVELRKDPVAFSKVEEYLSNATRPVPAAHQGMTRTKNSITDSGGYQMITLGIIKDRDCLVGPLYLTDIKPAKGDVKKQGKPIVLGVFSNCEEYSRIGADVGFCIDFPPILFDDEKYSFLEIQLERFSKLHESMIARDEMLQLAPVVCPRTKLGIVLQPGNPLNVEAYFVSIWHPEIQTYAYPGQVGRKYAINNAYVFSFLYSMGVRHFHFLGSSTPSVIIVLAKAMTLGMFHRITFDSSTWNTKIRIRKGSKYLDPRTLKKLPRKKLENDQNLRWELVKFGVPFHQFEKKYNPPRLMIAGEWQGLWNIHAIQYFKNNALDKIMSGLTSELLAEAFPKGKPDQLVAALNLLDEAKTKGHGFVKNEYRPILLEQYDQDL